MSQDFRAGICEFGGEISPINGSEINTGHVQPRPPQLASRYSDFIHRFQDDYGVVNSSVI